MTCRKYHNMLFGLFGQFFQINLCKFVRKIFKCNLVNLWQILWQRSAASKGFRNINLSRFCQAAEKACWDILFLCPSNLTNLTNICNINLSRFCRAAQKGFQEVLFLCPSNLTNLCPTNLTNLTNILIFPSVDKCFHKYILWWCHICHNIALSYQCAVL